MDAFAEHYHIYAVDTRGHGRTPRGSAPFTISQFADDLKEFMDAHKIERAHILGFSDGGNIALMFAIRWEMALISMARARKFRSGRCRISFPVISFRMTAE